MTWKFRFTTLVQPCQGTNNGTLEAMGSGGTPPYSYLWSTSATGPVVIGVSPGTYGVTILDAEGCTAEEMVTLIGLENPTCVASVVQPISTPGGNDGIVTVTPGGGLPPYTYNWNNLQTTQTISNLSEGIYTVTVTDANGCTTTCGVELGDPPSAKVGDKVWNDEDEDGLQDANEVGVSGVNITLEGTDENGNPISIFTTTDALGMYLFDPVPPGTYKLTFDLPTGFEFSIQNSGSNDDIDSDVDPVTGMTDFFTLEDEDCDLSIDAGISTECINFTDPGEIAADEYLCGPGNDPAPIIEVVPPSGGVGAIEFLWMFSTSSGPFDPNTWTPIPNSNTPNYDPGPIFVTTYYARCVRRDGLLLVPRIQYYYQRSRR